MEHYGHLSDSLNEQKAALYMRGLLLRYTKGLPMSGRFRDRFSRIKDLKSLISAMDSYFTMLEGEKI